MIVHVCQQFIKANISELETIKCHVVLLDLETVFQAKCSVYQKYKRPVYDYL